MVMGRKLEFFSAGCPLCVQFQEDVELGKCGTCDLEIIDVKDQASRRRVKKYDVRVVPTLVIDGRVKVEGRIAEPWVCGDEFFTMLERTHPLVPPR